MILGAFGYQYGGLDNDDNELTKMLNNLLFVVIIFMMIRYLYLRYSHDAGVLPSRAAVLISALPRVLPGPLLYLLDLIPSRLKQRYTDFNVLMKEIGRQVLKQNLEGGVASSTGKDILSILGEPYWLNVPRHYLTLCSF